MDSFSERLKVSRENRGLSQREVAKVIGISQAYYVRFEKGTGEPNLAALGKLADLLLVTTDFLLCRTEAQTRSRTVTIDGIDIQITIRN